MLRLVGGRLVAVRTRPHHPDLDILMQRGIKVVAEFVVKVG